MSEKIEAPWGPTELDKSAESLIKEMEGEFATTALDTEIAEPALAAPDGAEANPDIVAAPVAEKPPEVVKDPPLSEALRRELGLIAREDAEKASNARIKALEEELKGYKARELPEDIVDGLRTSTTRTLEQLGLDPDYVVRMVLADRLGDKAPEDLRAEIAQATKDQRYEQKLRALEAKIHSQEQSAAARAYYEGIQAGARKFISDPGISEHAPVVAKVAKTAPERVFQEMMEVISQDAQIKAVRDPSAPIMTYQEAAKRVEERWADLNKALGSPVPANAPSDPAKTPTPKPPSNQATTMKAPDRPIAPWLQRTSELESEGLKAGLAEYRRLQTPGS